MSNFFNKSLLPLLCAYFIAASPALHATHIIGGDMTYRCLGNNLYEIILTLRRDCINGQPPFDNPASVGIFDSKGILQTKLGLSGRLAMPFRPDDTLNEVLKKNCGIIGGDVCVHTTTYRSTLTLPYLDGGYILAYQRCCRNYTILNIENPLSTGATYTLEITDEALRTCNSSPKLSPYPPIYVCGNQNIEFDLQAKDTEDDSLVYMMCDPYLGADQISPQPTIPSAPPYTPVGFKLPYSTFDMIGGIPPLQINPKTGLMTGFAVNLVAQYLVAYCVLEYRNGKLLSRLRRDFQINVRICNSVPIADFDYTLDPCKSPVELKITDKSSDKYSTINSWEWEILLNSIKHNSTVQNPVITLTDSGIAKVQLVIHSKESCDDTINKNISIYSIVPTFYNATDSICLGDSIELVKQFNAGVNYVWTPAKGLSCDHCPNPKASPFKNTKYVLATSDSTCLRLDTISILVKNCLADSCAVYIEKTCLPNGMIEIAAIDERGNRIQTQQRIHELFWSVKQSLNYPEVSLINKNPILLTSDRAFTLTSKLYSWKPGLPKSIEYADICKRVLTDSSNLSCSGPCEEIQFILSSCEDDYDLANNLNFPPAICQSICSNACNYIVALFETNGTLINPANYKIKWSTGATGSYVMMMGPYYNTLTVEVQKGDCIWYGRYWKSCKNYPHSIKTDLPGLNMLNAGVIDQRNVDALMQRSNSILIYNLEGQLISKNKNQIENLEQGIYYLVLENGDYRIVYKLIK